MLGNPLVELIYDFVLNLVSKQIGGLFGNGMIPYSFTVTSHFLITLGLSFSIFIGRAGLGPIRRESKGCQIWLLEQTLASIVSMYIVTLNLHSETRSTPVCLGEPRYIFVFLCVCVIYGWIYVVPRSTRVCASTIAITTVGFQRNGLHF
ncbi:hypothetical protein DVH24_016370 [Malus domestica]|uniref:F-ATPase protein 6 n=1 Tax=Malus domestica TaxID=3750 RepID=A0A498HPT2_MALDO|nr:hypothetical protein DVH24_016370 [Malus domestica]